MIDKLRLDLVQLYSQGKVNLVTFKKINEIIENLDNIEGIGDLTALTQRVNELENTTEQLKNLAENLSDRLFALESNLALQIESIVDEKIGTLNEDVALLKTQYTTLTTRTNNLINRMYADYNEPVYSIYNNDNLFEVLGGLDSDLACYEIFCSNREGNLRFVISDTQSWSIESGTLTRYTQGTVITLNGAFKRIRAIGNQGAGKMLFIIEHLSSYPNVNYTYHYVVTNSMITNISMTAIKEKAGVFL